MLSYTNNLYDIDIESNETIAYSIEQNAFSGFYAFTPEKYSYVDGHFKGLSLISFKEGIPYFHNLENVSTYNIFFGTQTDQVIQVVFNASPETEKRFMAIAIDSKNRSGILSGVKYRVENMITSDNLVSLIPQSAFKFRENWYYAPVMRSTSLDGTLQTGQGMRGTWMECTLVRDDAVADGYSEFAKAVCFFMTSERSVK